MKKKFNKKTVFITTITAAFIIGGTAAAFGAWNQVHANRIHDTGNSRHHQGMNYHSRYNCYVSSVHHEDARNHGYHASGVYIHGHDRTSQTAGQKLEKQAETRLENQDSQGKR